MSNLSVFRSTPEIKITRNVKKLEKLRRKPKSSIFLFPQDNYFPLFDPFSFIPKNSSFSSSFFLSFSSFFSFLFIFFLLNYVMNAIVHNFLMVFRIILFAYYFRQHTKTHISKKDKTKMLSKSWGKYNKSNSIINSEIGLNQRHSVHICYCLKWGHQFAS